MEKEVVGVKKLLLIGDSNVGKTTFMNIITNQKRIHQKLVIPPDFISKTILIDQKYFQIDLWDSEGKYFQLRKSFYQNADGIFLCFDLSNFQSFNNLSKWINEIKLNVDGIPIFLIGMKLDLIDERKVFHSEIRPYLGTFGYFELSSKTLENVQETFHTCVDQMVTKKYTTGIFHSQEKEYCLIL
jgi:Ras-related protein Rab-1A